MCSPKERLPVHTYIYIYICKVNPDYVGHIGLLRVIISELHGVM